MEKKIAKRLLIEIIILVIVLTIWSTRPINAYKIRIYFIKMKLLNTPYSVIILNNRRRIKGKIIKENDKSLTLIVEAGEAVINKADIKDIVAEAPGPK